MSADLRRERQAAYDKTDCPNGPDEHGDWPCDPKLLYGSPLAECQVCGRVAAWSSETGAREEGAADA